MALTDKVTAAMLAELRRMIAEPTTATYDDDTLRGYVAKYPCLDELGEVPFTWDTATDPPTQEDNDAWVATFDLHAAAADLWQEKAAIVAQDFDFQADGGSYSRSKVYEQYQQMARYHRARRKIKTHTLHMHPDPGFADVYRWIGNLPERDR